MSVEFESDDDVIYQGQLRQIYNVAEDGCYLWDEDGDGPEGGTVPFAELSKPGPSPKSPKSFPPAPAPAPKAPPPLSPMPTEEPDEDLEGIAEKLRLAKERLDKLIEQFKSEGEDSEKFNIPFRVAQALWLIDSSNSEQFEDLIAEVANEIEWGMGEDSFCESVAVCYDKIELSKSPLMMLQMAYERAVACPRTYSSGKRRGLYNLVGTIAYEMSRLSSGESFKLIQKELADLLHTECNKVNQKRVSELIQLLVNGNVLAFARLSRKDGNDYRYVGRDWDETEL